MSCTTDRLRRDFRPALRLCTKTDTDVRGGCGQVAATMTTEVGAAQASGCLSKLRSTASPIYEQLRPAR